MKTDHKITDMATRNTFEVSVEVEPHGVCIIPKGLCDQYGPIFFEWYDGKPRLVVWTDKDSPDPTHIIDLSGATNGKTIH
jgi:hypothetical protein